MKSFLIFIISLCVIIHQLFPFCLIPIVIYNNIYSESSHNDYYDTDDYDDYDDEIITNESSYYYDVGDIIAEDNNESYQIVYPESDCPISLGKYGIIKYPDDRMTVIDDEAHILKYNTCDVVVTFGALSIPKDTDSVEDYLMYDIIGDVNFTSANVKYREGWREHRVINGDTEKQIKVYHKEATSGTHLIWIKAEVGSDAIYNASVINTLASIMEASIINNEAITDDTETADTTTESTESSETAENDEEYEDQKQDVYSPDGYRIATVADISDSISSSEILLGQCKLYLGIKLSEVLDKGLTLSHSTLTPESVITDGETYNTTLVTNDGINVNVIIQNNFGKECCVADCVITYIDFNVANNLSVYSLADDYFILPGGLLILVTREYLEQYYGQPHIVSSLGDNEFSDRQYKWVFDDREIVVVIGASGGIKRYMASIIK